MRFILDTNEFVAAFKIVPKPPSVILLAKLLESIPDNSLHIPRTIINEVRRNVPRAIFSEFIKIIQTKAAIDEDVLVPFEIGSKYEGLGLKPADAFIAAYAEWINADVLVTENRHFLSRRSDLPFRVLTAEKVLKIL